jgi:hypothetical protein
MKIWLTGNTSCKVNKPHFIVVLLPIFLLWFFMLFEVSLRFFRIAQRFFKNGLISSSRLGWFGGERRSREGNPSFCFVLRILIPNCISFSDDDSIVECGIFRLETLRLSLQDLAGVGCWCMRPRTKSTQITQSTFRYLLYIHRYMSRYVLLAATTSGLEVAQLPFPWQSPATDFLIK